MNTNKKTMMILKDIVKSYGHVKVLKSVSADIAEGEMVTFVGPSGCGKTTLLRCIGGLTKINSGDVILDGRNIKNLTPDKRGTQMCFQNYALFPHMTVAENVGYGLMVHKWSKSDIKRRVEEMLQLVHLEGLGDRNISRLSGGQQQRVALARALALEPKVLLLDEPLSNLDANLRVLMRASLREIQKRVNITTIFVTHDQFEAMSISDKLIVMRDGIIEQVGSPSEIYEKPKSEFVASFVGYVNILSGTVEKAEKEDQPITISTELGLFTAQSNGQEINTGDKVYIVIRPETVRINAKGEEEGENIVTGTIASSMYAGSTIKYTVTVKDRNLTVDQYDPSNIGIREIGEEIKLSIPGNVHILKK